MDTEHVCCPFARICVTKGDFTIHTCDAITLGGDR